MIDIQNRCSTMQSVTVAAAPHSLEGNRSGGPPFRLVLPRAKRDRLIRLAATLTRRRGCSVADCGAEGMPVLLVEAELEAVLCPIHQLVRLDGSAVEGQPMLATAIW
jgi:hypothetical protein